MAARTRNIFEAIIQSWIGEGQIEQFDGGVSVDVQSRKNQQTQVNVIFSQFWIWYFEFKTWTNYNNH